MAEARQGVLEPGRNCWKLAEADRLAVIIDGADYFDAARRAMLQAQKSIMLIGWDFDARLRLVPADDGGPEALGDFVIWLADRRPGLQIRLLRWDVGALKAVLFRGKTLLTVLRWKMHPRITLRLDRKHPLASSHHQKIIVIDDRLAFCGGIDMTLDRWDTSEHLDDDPRRRRPNGAVYGPWHDAATMFDGPAAAALGELARQRWHIAGGEDLPALAAEGDLWPEGVTPTATDLRLGIARSRPKQPDLNEIHEVEQSYLDMIASARQVIYAESQYFASRLIARAIAARLLEDDGPEVVIINPVSAQGWLEPLAMDTARARLIEALQRIDRHGRLRIYHPVTAAGQPIFVHAKLMVVDDRLLRVGSSNVNNRSMRLDTECDVLLDAGLPGNDGLSAPISDLRNRLVAEHLGVSPDAVAARLAESGSLIAVIEGLRGAGRSLVPYTLPALSGIEQWLADNEILDPNGPEEIFEAPSRRGLFKGWNRLRARLHRRAR